MVEAYFGPTGHEGLLSTMRYERPPVVVDRKPGTSDAPASAPLPGSSRPPSVRPAAGAPASRDEPPSTAKPRKRESFRPPELGPLPDYAAQARRPAPDADEPDSDRGKPASVPEPAARKEAEHAPEPAHTPSTRPPSSAAHVAVAPPASAPVLAPGPAIIAAGLGERPRVGREVRSDRPPPHPPPTRITNRPSLFNPLGGAPLEQPRSDPKRAAADFESRHRASAAPPVTPPPVLAPRPRVPELLPPPLPRPEAEAQGDGTHEPDDEPTVLQPRPSPEALGLAPGAGRIRATYATLPSMSAVVPPSARPETATVGATAGDDEPGKPPTAGPTR
jgi:hypothetical protein